MRISTRPEALPAAIRRCVQLLAALLCAWLAAACAEPARVESLQMVALGTIFSISVVDPPTDWRVGAEDAVRVRLARWDRDMYPYRDGELARANAAFARGDCVTPSALLRAMIDTAQFFERRHPGLFNPALAQDTRRWGFDQLDALNTAPSPQHARAVDDSSSLNLHMDGARICSAGPVALDFGGFAKGVVVDELLEALAQLGHTDLIVNAGGDLRVLGDRAGGLWRVAIRDPHGPGALAGLRLHDGESVFTSGNYERHIERDGRRYGHIFDPQTGAPLTGIASVTVLGTDPARTDAAATALYVAAARSIERGATPAAMARVADADAFLIVDESGKSWLNDAMLKRIIWTKEPPKFSIVGNNHE